MRRTWFALVIALAAVAGCATYEQELQRAEEHFTHNEDENTLATLRALETDWFRFGDRDRARYAYLRGMTDYRIGFKADARHWLAIAAQIDREHPGALEANERTQVDEKLGALNKIVWAGDVLPQEETPGTAPKAAPAPEPKAEPEADSEPPAKSDESEPKAKPAEEDDSPKPKKKKSKSEPTAE